MFGRDFNFFYKCNIIICVILVVLSAFFQVFDVVPQTPLEALMNNPDCKRPMAYPNQPEVEFQHLQEMTKISIMDEDYENAERQLLRQVCLAHDIDGQNSLTFAGVMSQIGKIFLEQGRTNEAFFFLHETLLIEEKLLSPDDDRQLANWNTMARIYIELGQINNAQELLAEIIIDLQKKPKSIEQAVAFKHLAMAHKNDQQLSKRYCEKSISILDDLRQFHNRHFPYLLNLMAELKSISEPEAAIALAQRSITLSQLIFKKVNPTIKRSYQILCSLNQTQYCSQF